MWAIGSSIDRFNNLYVHTHIHHARICMHVHYRHYFQLTHTLIIIVHLWIWTNIQAVLLFWKWIQINRPNWIRKLIWKCLTNLQCWLMCINISSITIAANTCYRRYHTATTTLSSPPPPPSQCRIGHIENETIPFAWWYSKSSYVHVHCTRTRTHTCIFFCRTFDKSKWK